MTVDPPPDGKTEGRPRRILVTGSRDWTDRSTILEALADEWDPDTILVSGACPTGADRLAESVWEDFFGGTVERHPANWDRYGKAAGPRRNQEMVDLGAEVCLAFPLPGSRGTVDCAKKATAAGIPVRPAGPHADILRGLGGDA